MFQQSVIDLQRQSQRLMNMTGTLEHNNQERLRHLQGSMAEPLQSLPDVKRADPLSFGSVNQKHTNAVESTNGSRIALDHPRPASAGESAVPGAVESLPVPALPTEASANLSTDAWTQAYDLLKQSLPSMVNNFENLPGVRNMEDVTTTLELRFHEQSARQWSFNSPKAVMVWATGSVLADVVVGSWDAVLDALRDAIEAINICQREYELYPDPILREKLVKVYIEVLHFNMNAMKWFQSLSSKD